jgi:hypothetical protein
VSISVLLRLWRETFLATGGTVTQGGAMVVVLLQTEFVMEIGKGFFI